MREDDRQFMAGFGQLINALGGGAIEVTHSPNQMLMTLVTAPVLSQVRSH